ncbi:MAG: hypothetical protein ACI915_002572 [Gammaproteobacteria bacterium]|jgi:hypothetical protein
MVSLAFEMFAKSARLGPDRANSTATNRVRHNPPGKNNAVAWVDKKFSRAKKSPLDDGGWLLKVWMPPVLASDQQCFEFAR